MKKNIEQAIWAYNYIVKTFKPRFDREYFKINNENDYYNIVICYFDGIINAYEKNDKFTSLKNAWSQKKYRDDNNGKKSYSFNMSIDIAKKLDILAANSNRSKNYIVEGLINTEYLKLKKMKYIELLYSSSIFILSIPHQPIINIYIIFTISFQLHQRDIMII
ncbi:hypothetical protein UB34_14035 [Photobacterium leiognathi]|nr:hypothetical protein UB34_14035 [Photobacterium leiognathi]